MKEASIPADETANKSDEILLDHDYDGIQEYDNPLPRWYKQIFLWSIVFSFCYLFYYHITGAGPSLQELYAQDMAALRAQQAQELLTHKVTEQSLSELMADEMMMKDARALFVERCQVCHADRAQGNIGPNLTDGFWIHGKGSLMDIYQVVSNGVAQKGMPAWSKQLPPLQVRMLAAYVGSLRNTNVAGKGPEGTPVQQKEPAP